jgi:hypothetical protein
MDMEGLAIGIDDDISGIGVLLWTASAVELEEEEHAAAASASTATPTAPRRTEPGRERPRQQVVRMNNLLRSPHPLTGTTADGFDDAC